MATAITAKFPQSSIHKKPGGKGDFIVTVDGKELWNKLTHADARFPEHDEILSMMACKT